MSALPLGDCPLGICDGTGLIESTDFTGDTEQPCACRMGRARRSIYELIERSSLGSPEAKAMRAQTSPEQVARVMARVRQLRERDR